MNFEIVESNFVVPKTARYFSSGKINGDTTEIWFVLHGYGQHAGYFLRKFVPFFSSNKVFIAPEGLSRFYAEGASGRVVASWMTKENRLDEINDYVNWLNKLVEVLQIPKHTKINVLGFSQGAASLARWVNQASFEPAKALIYAGVFPPDLELKFDSVWSAIEVSVILGENDPYYKPLAFMESFQELQDKCKSLEYVTFVGGHEINVAVLRTLMDK